VTLATTRSGADAIIEIKNRLGIDLKWETAYARFIHWQQQQHRGGALANVLTIWQNGVLLNY